MMLHKGNSTKSDVAIEVRDLVKTYPGGVRALDSLSFTVETGTVFGLLGPNGAGKSTAVKILTTLSRPDAGEARIAGVEVTRHPQWVRRVIGVVAQKPGADPNATGRENLMLQGRFYGLSGKELKRRVHELLERFALADAADRLVRSYSGGMQRRLDIAMGLIHKPRVLFLDEPTTGLDPEIRTVMWEEIARLARGEGLTILLTTHYLEEADRLAQRLAIMDRGRVVAEGTPDKLKAELRGDAVHVELAEPSQDGHVQRALGKLSGVRELVLEGKALHARVDSGATALPQLLGALEAEGVAVASVSMARPSLDDVYLKHTGRTFEQAGKEVA